MKEYKIKEGFMLRKIAGNYVVVAIGKVGKEFNGMINLNESGAFLFDLLKKYQTLDFLVEELMKEYEIETKIAKNDVLEFLHILEENGICECK